MKCECSGFGVDRDGLETKIKRIEWRLLRRTWTEMCSIFYASRTYMVDKCKSFLLFGVDTADGNSGATRLRCGGWDRSKYEDEALSCFFNNLALRLSTVDISSTWFDVPRESNVKVGAAEGNKTPAK
jgi:hypothetical protein